MKVYDNVLQTIGNTPMIRLNKIAADMPCPVYGKVETYNPGHSIKDRMALKMVEVAEAEGKLKPGGTIIECTSGNTGMGLALAACVRGYKCIFTTTDKQSKEKIDILKAVGAEVIVCPTNVTPDDPKSYYATAERLSKTIPNSFWFNQYDNLANRQAHYESTGPEIWDQTDGKITHLIVGVGTGGTISGTARFLKEKNPDVQIWGIDTYGSVFKKYLETGKFDEKEIYPYITEGIGEDILPENVDFSLIDKFEKVTDKDGAVYARKLAKSEGLLLGYSAGSAMAGALQMKDHLKPDDLVVIIFHDHGSRYVGKIYNDEWMRERGFLEDDLTVQDLIEQKESVNFLSISPTQTVKQALELMKEHDLSQLPVEEDGKVIGSVTENTVLNYILDSPMQHADKPVSEIMSDSFPIVTPDMLVKELSRYIDKANPAVMVKDSIGYRHILTNYDILQAL